jgi:simple sugar transport system ATP-binding protein
VLLVSSELSELRALADRIVVLYRGRIAAEVAPDVDDDRIGRLMIGGAAAPQAERRP